MNDDLKAKLLELGLTDEHIGKLAENGVASSDDMALLSDAEIKDLTGCGLVTAKRVAQAFAPEPVAVDPTVSMDLLPTVPDDTSFLEMLRVGGVLKVTETDVIAAMRATIASEVGLYDLPHTILAKMEAFAEEQAEPVGSDFFELQTLVTQRGYGDLLTALGVPGNFVSNRRKEVLLTKLEATLWQALSGFHNQLVKWTEAWTSTASNPALALTMLAMSQSGSRGIMPPGMLQPPETAGLRDEAEGVIDEINKVFAGVGIPVARALAYDATRIKGILENPALPAAIGATTREQMLRSLGVDVGSDYVRLERNVSRYALAIMELPKLGSGQEEYGYLGAMLQLGAQIPWDKLGGGRKGGRPGKGGTFRDEEQ